MIRGDGSFEEAETFRLQLSRFRFSALTFEQAGESSLNFRVAPRGQESAIAGFRRNRVALPFVETAEEVEGECEANVHGRISMKRVNNPPNPFQRETIEWSDDEPPPEAKLEVFKETATRTIITHNTSPDIGFDYSVNPYRGCTHACSYCFARPYHEYLGFGAGTDFERKIIVKTRAPELLRTELMKPSWKGETLAFSFTCDPYLPLENSYRIIRRCLEVCAEFRQPVEIVTKSALVVRDTDLLVRLTQHATCAVNLTIRFADQATARALEPFAPSPDARFRAMRELSQAGVTVNIGIAPMIPGLNDAHIPELLQQARERGATGAWMSMLRLPGSVADYFVENLETRLPTKAARVISHIREERGGKLNASDFGARMRGTSEAWKVTEALFKLYHRKLGFDSREDHAMKASGTFRRPSPQGSLFEL